MIAIFDAAYDDTRGVAACVLASTWTAPVAHSEYRATSTEVAAYQPGEFYKRELPLIMAAIPAEVFRLAVVDGYAWLGPKREPGLGAHLHAALGKSIPVIGIAKTRYANTPAAEVLRGASERPLFISAVGVELHDAAGWIRDMHGAGRLPTLIKRADRLARLTLNSSEGGCPLPASSCLSGDRGRVSAFRRSFAVGRE